jgi:hypothetical protein
VRNGFLWSVPEPFEASSAGARVARRVLDVLVSEVVLYQPEVRHVGAVGKVIAAGVPQHVWPDVAELGALAGLASWSAPLNRCQAD